MNMKKIDIGIKIISILESYGYKAYFVGGIVRDYLLKRKISDLDIATDAHPKQVMGIFSHSIPTGIKHGTVTVIIDGIPCEITTFRKEGKYTDSRRPDSVQFVKNLEEDLSRRDFTMNAIAMSKDKKIIDPFNGLKALNERKIIAVGNPVIRFNEDALRMLRAIRFTSQLNFIIDEKTWSALLEYSTSIRYVAVERIKNELEKIFKSDNPSYAIKLLYKANLLNWVDGLENFFICNLIDTKLLDISKEYYIRLAIFLINFNYQDRQKILKRLRFSNKEITIINQLFYSLGNLRKSINYQDDIKYCLINSNKENCLHAVELLFILQMITQKQKNNLITEISKLDKQLTVRSEKDLAITGTDLINFFEKPGGAWVGKILNTLTSEVIYNNLLNNQKELIKKAKKLMRENNYEK